MIAQVTRGKALPLEVLQQVVTKTDGVPLFVEELTKTVLESGLLREAQGQYALTGPLTPTGHSRHATRFPHGPTGSPGDGQSGGPTGGRPGAHLRV